ncbi:hypothetical protein H4R20_006285 [Coemansia guatemalensis]|uniref:Uncharacterized protein n=1 Tax=Coemansia guatemalensis TaxID=2761395 RepID=A0A9W8HW80_9FUNG|nr:hypothetical protein H4R20_006285 [Coemansia guatemalensis]
MSGVDAEAMFKDQPLVRRNLKCLDLSETVEQHADYLDRLDDIMLEITQLL